GEWSPFPVNGEGKLGAPADAL
ncbi:MAG: hypothetical protein JWP23_506, partial [Phenylobacterium sp.]|nr:hypothetical protein [Phenylobacterium sp.]